LKVISSPAAMSRNAVIQMRPPLNSASQLGAQL